MSEKKFSLEWFKEATVYEPPTTEITTTKVEESFDTLIRSGKLVNDVKIGEFEMPWETKGDQYAGEYPPWHQWAIKEKGFYFLFMEGKGGQSRFSLFGEHYYYGGRYSDSCLFRFFRSRRFSLGCCLRMVGNQEEG